MSPSSVEELKAGRTHADYLADAASSAADTAIGPAASDMSDLGSHLGLGRGSSSLLQHAVDAGAQELEDRGSDGIVAAVMAAPPHELASASEMTARDATSAVAGSVASHAKDAETEAATDAATATDVASDATGSFGNFLKTFIPGGAANLPMPSGDTSVETLGGVGEVASEGLATIQDSLLNDVADIGSDTASDVASNVGIDSVADISTGAAMAATATATGFMATLSSMASSGVATTAKALRHAGSCVSSAYNVAEDWAMRNPLYATSAGLVAATTVVGGAAWMWRNSKKKAKEAEEKQRSQMSRIADLEHSEQSLRSELTHYKAALGSAQSAERQQKPEVSSRSLFGGSGEKLSGLSATPPPPGKGWSQPPGRPAPGGPARR